MNETRSVGKEPAVSEAAKVGPEQAGASAAAGTVASSDAPPEVFEVNGAQTYRVSLPTFEGPLDLLLHLVQKHELDILDIPIGFVARKYVEYIRMMEELSIDIASEYLVMAATLAYIKSRSLLPPDPTQVEEEVPEDEEDPRAELIRRLLEYQKYKLAAEQLGERSVLGRDVFPRGAPIEASTDPAPLAPLSLFRLVDAFGDVLKRAKHVEEHTINFERISISDKIGSINELLSQKGSLKFEELFVDDRTRAEMIVTFLALLEMTKLRMVYLRQDDPLGPITIDLRVREQDAEDEPWLAATRITSDSPSAAPPVQAPAAEEPESDEEFDESADFNEAEEDEAEEDEAEEDEAEEDEAEEDEAEEDEAEEDEAEEDEAEEQALGSATEIAIRLEEAVPEFTHDTDPEDAPELQAEPLDSVTLVSLELQIEVGQAALASPAIEGSSAEAELTFPPVDAGDPSESDADPDAGLLEASAEVLEPRALTDVSEPSDEAGPSEGEMSEPNPSPAPIDASESDADSEVLASEDAAQSDAPVETESTASLDSPPSDTASSSTATTTKAPDPSDEEDGLD